MSFALKWLLLLKVHEFPVFLLYLFAFLLPVASCILKVILIVPVGTRTSLVGAPEAAAAVENSFIVISGLSEATRV